MSTISDRKRDMLMAELFMWQEFIRHPAWREMRERLEEERAAFQQTLLSLHAGMTAEIACAQGQYRAVDAMLDYPAARLRELERLVSSD